MHVTSYFQLHTAIKESFDPVSLGIGKGSPLLGSLKGFLIRLACSESSHLSVVQQNSQQVLETCWRLLMPTVCERARTLSGLLEEGAFHNFTNLHLFDQSCHVFSIYMTKASVEVP